MMKETKYKNNAKILDKYKNVYYISIRQRGKPRRRGENPMGFRDSDSLLHSLSSGLWAPNFKS